MIGILDYGMGNLRSVRKAFQHLGETAELIASPEGLRGLDRLVIPGVGAFPDAMAHLAKQGLDQAIEEFAQTGKPVLGICLGMQVLFDEGEEFGRHAGLKLIPGRVVRFQAGAGKIPHIGWNEVSVKQSAPWMGDAAAGGSFYFVHSFHCVPREDAVVVGTTDYGGLFASAVQRDNLAAVQFHPEKSQAVGLKLLAGFAAWRP